jgi:NAD(P)-dependent dehydrogenase (short-subunit alcohol dehydrogenase family)
LAIDRVTLLTDDERGVGRILAEELRARGREIALVRLGDVTAETHPGNYTTDLGSPDSVARLLDTVRRRQGPVGGIIHLLPLRSGVCFEEMDFESWRQRLRVETKSLFSLVKGLIADLDGATRGEPACVLAATAMGGNFGNGRSFETNGFFPGQGAILGLLKTLGQEWPHLRVKAVDLDPEEAIESLAARLLAEVTDGDEELEVGYAGRSRLTLQPRAAPVDRAGSTGLSPDDSWVILVTGGARGITAEVAIELAQQYRPTLLLVGRSPMPEAEESPSTGGLPVGHALKAALMEKMREAGETVTPARVEERYARLCRDREIRNNVAAMERAGARVHYYQAEVRDERAFGDLIDEIYRSFGRLDGVIHGAGVIEDKLIKDKALDSFDRVFDTKADSAFILSRKLQSDSLKFLVFFSSVAGRFGNRGQADYAAANEVLNKLAVYLDRLWPGRVVSLNWGPWATTGMVSPEVRRQFAERGVHLIPPAVGRRRLNEELRYGRKGEVEVIIGGGTWTSASAGKESRPASPTQGALIGHVPEAARAPDGSVTISLELDTSRHLYLKDHRIDGQPVLPMAAAVEMMAELAAQGWPELSVAGVRDLQLLQGLVLRDARAAVRLVARPQVPASPERSRVDVEIADLENPRRIHYRASVEMARRLPDPPSPVLPPIGEARPFPLPVDEAYRRWLFHGPLFQGITRLDRIGVDGIEGSLTPSSPRQWIEGAPESRWLIDPVIFDCGLQMLVLWVREHWDMMSLPSRFLAYHRFATPSTTEIRCEIRVRPDERSHIVHADLYFLEVGGRLLGILEDMEGACSKKLNRVVGGSTGMRPAP